MIGDDYTSIDLQLATALERIECSRSSIRAHTDTKVQPDAISDPAIDKCSVDELYQLAYQRVEDELDTLRSDMRQLREKHKAAEAALERRLLQKEALRRKIIASATGNPDQI